MEKMGILPTALFVAAALILVWPREVAGYASEHKCVHEPVQPIVGVHIAGSGGPVRDRRFARRSSEFKPMRLFIHYDDSVNTELSESDRNRLQNNVIPSIKNYFEAALNTTPLTGPILLDRDCDGTLTMRQTETVKECINGCMNVTTCGGFVVIPEDHLKHCVECDGSNKTDDCVTRRGTVDGAGIPNADMVIYVSTIPCNDPYTIAFAGACQLESKYDRPIAGLINFCPKMFNQITDQASIVTGIHEVMHALAFSPSLFPFYRDSYGNPRTPRDQDGYPPKKGEDEFVASNNTVATVTYDDWLTRDGPISHQVEMIVTPKVVEEAKAQFGCNEAIGVELENQGGNGTAGGHWEHRVLGNEGMTGVDLFNPVYSRITLALFEDSGWYRVNYSLAEPLAWGRNRGCNIPHGSCAAHIKEQEASQRTLSPFCKELGSKTSCTVDRDSSAQCSLTYVDKEIPPEFQYFNDDVAPNSHQLGSGGFIYTDFCPFQYPYNLISCSNPSNLPNPNLAGETYGPGSRCIEHGRDWTRTLASRGYVESNFDEVGCYQYSCSQSGVEIVFLGTRYLCSCEGEELVINTTIGDAQYVGSFICPSCLSLCFDELDNCPEPEPPACPGRVTQAVPLEIVDVQAFCSHVVWRIPSNLPCGYVSGYDIRLVNTVTNQEVVQRVDTSATFYSLGNDDSAKKPTSVQVRFVSANGTTGPFSPLIPLGCQAPEPSVYFELNGVALANNSVIKMADVGSGESSLLCKTDRESCCGTPPDREGEFYYPNGVQVPIRNAGHAFYRDRREQRIRLNRRLGANAPTGVFRCEIRDASGVIQKLFITLRE